MTMDVIHNHNSAATQLHFSFSSSSSSASTFFSLLLDDFPFNNAWLFIENNQGVQGNLPRQVVCLGLKQDY